MHAHCPPVLAVGLCLQLQTCRCCWLLLWAFAGCSGRTWHLEALPLKMDFFPANFIQGFALRAHTRTGTHTASTHACAHAHTTHTRSLSLPPSLSLTHTHTHSLSLSHTHTHTHTCSPPPPHTHTRTCTCASVPLLMLSVCVKVVLCTNYPSVVGFVVCCTS